MLLIFFFIRIQMHEAGKGLIHSGVNRIKAFNAAPVPREARINLNSFLLASVLQSFIVIIMFECYSSKMSNNV